MQPLIQVIFAYKRVIHTTRSKSRSTFIFLCFSDFFISLLLFFDRYEHMMLVVVMNLLFSMLYVKD